MLPNEWTLASVSFITRSLLVAASGILPPAVSPIKSQSSFLPPVKCSCSSVSALNSHSTVLAQAPPVPFRLPLTAFLSLLCPPNHPSSIQPTASLSPLKIIHPYACARLRKTWPPNSLKVHFNMVALTPPSALTFSLTVSPYKIKCFRLLIFLELLQTLFVSRQDLTIYPRLALNLRPFSHSLPSVQIIGVNFNAGSPFSL